MTGKATSKRYHDYVIKDGKLIGEFEEMYKACSDPWMQSKQPNKYSRMAGIVHINNFGIKSLLECGCGLGYYADWIHRETGIVPQSVDVSETCIQKAKQLFPYLDFEVADIAKDITRYKHVECIMFSEIMWYILPGLQSILKVIQNHFSGKYIIINQVFYKGTQQYGNDYFTNMRELIDYMPFQLLGSCEATTVNDTTIETSMIFRVGQSPQSVL